MNDLESLKTWSSQFKVFASQQASFCTVSVSTDCYVLRVLLICNLVSPLPGGPGCHVLEEPL